MADETPSFRFNVGSIVPVLLLFLTVIGAVWTIFQLQFSSRDTAIQLQFTTLDKTIEATREVVATDTKQVQEDLVRRNADLKEIINGLRLDISNVQANQEKYLTIREHGEFKETMQRQIDDIKKLQAERGAILVPRTESEARWSAIDAQMVLMQKEIEDINKQIAASILVKK